MYHSRACYTSAALICSFARAANLHAVERDTLTPLACMGAPWSLKRLAGSLSGSALAFLFLCGSLGLRITAWSKQCAKFFAACALVERLSRTAHVEVETEWS